MRDLQECQAEVFRRSENRIQKRKQRRRRIVTAIVPVVLCLAAFLLLWDPAEKTADSVDGATIRELSASTTAVQLAEITVTGQNLSLQSSNIEQMLPIYHILSQSPDGQNNLGGIRGEPMAPPDQENPEDATEYAVDAPEISEGLLDQESAIDTNKTSGSHEDDYNLYATPVYTITVTMEDGSRQVYLLTGNYLTDKNTSHTRTLSPREAEELLVLLGIPE